MIMRKFYPIIILILITITAAEMPLVVYAKKKSSSSSSDKSTEINRQIEEDRSRIDSAESEKEEIRKGMNDVEKIIDSLQAKKGDLEGYVKSLDSSLMSIQSEISGLNDKIDTLDKNLDELDSQISDKEKELDKAEQELDEAQQALETQYKDTREHIKYMYETRNATILDLILGSDGIKDLLNRAQYIAGMTRYDKGRLDEYATAVKKVEEKKETIAKEQKELDELKGSMEDTKEEISEEKDQVKAKEDDMNRLISAKEQEINAYDADISIREKQIEEYKRQIAEQDSIIRALEASIAARKAQLSGDVSGNEASSLPRYDGGKFTFPCPSYTRISDDYGNRMHPILKVERFHNGVDLAAASGSPILAAYDGEVIAADYSASMGNYIMIDHGDDVYTIYMHASSLLVSKGARVSAGQKIALVGSTGRSTGPHLHFSVRENGNYVSPWKYLK